MNRNDSFARKVNDLRTLLYRHHADVIRLQTQRTLAWLTGMRGFVNLAAVDGCAELWVDGSSVTLSATNIESARLMEEELAGLPISCVESPWYLANQEIVPKPFLDSTVLAERDVTEDLAQMQFILDEWEQQELRSLAKQTAEVVEKVAQEISKGQTEYMVVGEIARYLWGLGIEPIVLMAAADGRAFLRRHPLPTNQSIENYLLIAVCGRRGGRVASVTRAVHFGIPPTELLDRHHGAMYVDASAIAATKPGTELGDVFHTMLEAYAKVGHGDEWTHHHQGGVTGYASRTRVALPTDSFVLEQGMAVAWNPSIAGAKSEDTSLVQPNQAEILSGPNAEEWPIRQFLIDGISIHRPEILIRRTYFAT